MGSPLSAVVANIGALVRHTFPVDSGGDPLDPNVGRFKKFLGPRFLQTDIRLPRYPSEASYSLVNILGIRAGVYVRNIHHNSGDEVSNRHTGNNNFFECGIKPPFVLLGTFELHQKICRAHLPNTLDNDAQFFKFNPLYQVFRYDRVAHSLSGLY